jgi:hypothetical protein
MVQTSKTLISTMIRSWNGPTDNNNNNNINRRDGTGNRLIPYQETNYHPYPPFIQMVLSTLLFFQQADHRSARGNQAVSRHQQRQGQSGR